MEEALIFETGRLDATGVDIDEPPPFQSRLGPLRARSRARSSRTDRARGRAPLRAPVAQQLFDRRRHLSARLVHDEAQPAPQREDGAPARLCGRPSAPARLDRARRARGHRSARQGLVHDDRHGRGRDVAEGRRAWRALRHDGDQGGDRGARRGASAPCRSGSRFRPRHESGDRGPDRLFGALRAGERRRKRQRRGGARGTRARRRGDHADESQHLRAVRARDRRHRRRRARRRRVIFTATARISMRSSARPGRAISASTRCTSTCTRRFRPRTAAAARARGRSTLSSRLAPYAPIPFVVRDADGLRLVEHAEGGESLGRMCAFHGQMGMFVRALSFILSHGSDGLRQASEDAVLSANYVRASLNDVMSAPFGDRICMHEALFDDRWLKDTGTDDARFRQGDDRRGLPPDDGLFPARRSRRDADRADGIRIESEPRSVHHDAARSRIRREGRASASGFMSAPVHAPRRRLDETRAARQPVLRWTKPQPAWR